MAEAAAAMARLVVMMVATLGRRAGRPQDSAQLEGWYASNAL